MRKLQLLASLALCLFSFIQKAPAQTYTPKQIRIEGVADQDKAELLGIAALKPGPLTKQEIEAALQRLADSGLLSGVSYTVNSEALTLNLTALAGNEAMPVRYTNFVWWDPKELERLVEQRVAGFHGELKLHSVMTEDVSHALEAIAKDKGINARVGAVSDPTQHLVAMRIESPAVLFGELKLSEELRPAMGGTTAALEHSLHDQDFNSLETPATIVAGVTKVFSSGGYLDVTVDPPVFSAPYASLTGYAVDASVTIHRGEAYRVSAVTFTGAPAGTEGDLRKEASVKAGGLASSVAARLSNADLEGELALHGYLTAKSNDDATKNTSTHTVAYTFAIHPGPLFHLSAIDASRASPEIQAALSGDGRLQAGVLLDRSVTNAISEVIKKYDPSHKQRLSPNIQVDAGKQTASITLIPVTLPAGMRAPAPH